MSPSELKRRRVPSQQPSSLSLSSSDSEGDQQHPSRHHKQQQQQQGSDDSRGAEYAHLLPVSSFSSASSQAANGHSSSRRSSSSHDCDPDDKYSEKNAGFLRRALAAVSPLTSSRRLNSRQPHWLQARLLLPQPPLFDTRRPVYSALRLIVPSLLCFLVVVMLTLTLLGGRMALLYLLHPLSHLAPALLSSRPSLQASSNFSASALLLSPEEASSSDFSIVASFFDNSQSSSASVRMLQWHALLSFVSLTPPSHLIVYTSNPSECERFVLRAFDAIQCFQLSDVHPDIQLPFVNSLLQHVHRHAKTDLIVYAHHDVLLAPQLAASVHHLVDSIPAHAFVATSRRLDYRLSEELIQLPDLSRPYTEEIVSRARAAGRVYPNEWNVDFLLWSRAHFLRLHPAGFPGFVYSDYYGMSHLLASFLLDPAVAGVDLTPQQLVVHMKTNHTVDGIYVQDMRALHQHNLNIASNASHAAAYLAGHLSNAPYQLVGNCPACALRHRDDAGVQALARRVATRDGWLVVMDGDAASSLQQVRNWLCWAERANVTQFLLVSSAAQDAGWRELWQLGFPVLFVSGGGDAAPSQSFAQLVFFLLQRSLHLLLMDWDHLLLDSPFPYLLASPFDVMLKADQLNSYSGLVAMRSSDYSLYYWEAVLSCLQQRRTADDSAASACPVSSYQELRLRVKGGPLDILHFPNVKSFHVDQLSQRSGIFPLVLETSRRTLIDTGLLIARDDGSCDSAQRPPFDSVVTAALPFVVRILTSSNAAGLKALLDSLTASQYEEGVAVHVEIAVDFPASNGTEEAQGYRAVVQLASALQWKWGNVVVTVQELEAVGSARLFHTDVDAERQAFVLVLTDDVLLSSMWFITARRLLSLYAADPQLAAVSLMTEDVVLGETLSLRSESRHGLDEFPPASPSTVFFYQRPSSALLLLPHVHAELVHFMRLMQAAYPDYHPCVPTLVSNHGSEWQQWLSKWLYVRGWYALYLHLPDRAVLAMKQDEGAVPMRYFSRLVNVQSWTQLGLGQLQAKELDAVPVFDFHLRPVSARRTLESRAQVLRRSKQCWIMADWKEEAEAVDLQDDELSTEAEETRRHHERRRRHRQQQQSPPSASPSDEQAVRGTAAEHLAGHAVAENLVAGVYPPRKMQPQQQVAGDGQGKAEGAKVGDWAAAAAAAIAESEAGAAQDAVREERDRQQQLQQQQARLQQALDAMRNKPNAALTDGQKP